MYTACLAPSLATDMGASFPSLRLAVLHSWTSHADLPPLLLRRLAPHSATDVGILAYSLGATLLAAIQWIGDLRVRVLSISAAKPTGSCVWGLVLLRGKQARPEPAAGSVLEVLSGMLQAFQAPITTSVLPQVSAVCQTDRVLYMTSVLHQAGAACAFAGSNSAVWPSTQICPS